MCVDAMCNVGCADLGPDDVMPRAIVSHDQFA